MFPVRRPLCPAHPSPVSYYALVLDAAGMSIGRETTFLLPRHKPGIFVIRKAGLCTSIKLQVTTSSNKSGIWAVTSQPFSPPPSEI